MLLSDVMDQLGTALETIDGLRVFPYNADRVTPPAAIVQWPDEIEYSATMRRGMDRMTLPVMVVVGRADARATRDVLAAYLDGSGASSIVAALEGGTYTACDSVKVAGVPKGVEAVSIASVDYLAAEFVVEITGTGV
jgi:hypothetical protein